MGIIAWLLVGLIAGWLAGMAMGGRGFGVLGNIVVGVLGALIGVQWSLALSAMAVVLVALGLLMRDAGRGRALRSP